MRSPRLTLSSSFGHMELITTSQEKRAGWRAAPAPRPQNMGQRGNYNHITQHVSHTADYQQLMWSDFSQIIAFAELQLSSRRDFVKQYHYRT